QVQVSDCTLAHRHRCRSHEQHPVKQLVLQPVIRHQVEFLNRPVASLTGHHRHGRHDPLSHTLCHQVALSEDGSQRTPQLGCPHRLHVLTESPGPCSMRHADANSRLPECSQ